MSFKPISYLQTDSKWKSIDYSTSGESTTIGASGCGPTAAAMVVADWADENETPVEACKWSKANGYKACKQGTYYSFFEPYFKRFGLVCRRLNTANVYGNSSASAHDAARNSVRAGNYVIACMGKGNWTSSGHFVLWYGIDGERVLINDPNSTASGRINADFKLFKSQVKYYFSITKPSNLTLSGEKYTVTDKDGYINLRAGANTSYNVVDKLKTGTAVTVDKISGNWARTVHNGSRAYMNLAGLEKGAQTAQTAQFHDLKGHWAEKTVDELADMGIVHGDEKGNFRPDEGITRAEAAALVRNAVKFVTGK